MPRSSAVAVAALVLFGALHLMNVMVGQTLVQASLQFVLATLSGATLMLAALATRSLWLPVVAHGVYDFLVVDAARCAPTATTTARSPGRSRRSSRRAGCAPSASASTVRRPAPASSPVASRRTRSSAA